MIIVICVHRDSHRKKKKTPEKKTNETLRSGLLNLKTRKLYFANNYLTTLFKINRNILKSKVFIFEEV